MYSSILFDTKEESSLNMSAPKYFQDLRLDKIFSSIIKKAENYGIEACFYTPLKDVKNVLYRQEVFKDFQDKTVRMKFADFSHRLYHLLHYSSQLQEYMNSSDEFKNNFITRGHFLNTLSEYCDIISDMKESLLNFEIRSGALLSFKAYLISYCESPEFKKLNIRTNEVKEKFRSLRYCILIKNGTVKAAKDENEENLSDKITAAFQRFQEKESKTEVVKVRQEPYSEFMEANILKLLSKIFPDEFAALNSFSDEFIKFSCEDLFTFSKEITFYLSFLDFTDSIQSSSLKFCIPDIVSDSERIYADNFYDSALAKESGKDVVTNSFYLEPPERIIVVTGPNQGGKTTFARAFGQIHYLASLGLPVPGTKAGLILQDDIFTHFEKEESLKNRSGKLLDDLTRLKDITDNADENSIIVINEIFASTVINDAVSLTKHMLDKIIKSGSLCVMVTFIDEAAVYKPQTVSMMSTMDRESGKRTFQIVRKPPDGLAYACHLALSHRLTYDQISRRLSNES